MKVLELGIMVTDIVTKTKGMLTHLIIGLGHEQQYIFQPRGLNPKNGEPVEGIMIHKSRVNGGKEVELDVPLHLLGTEAEDIATGFKGTIIDLVYHLNGCLHLEIKPPGVVKTTGATFKPHQFDIRRMKGKAITPLKQKELKESIKKTPSPMPFEKRL